MCHEVLLEQRFAMIRVSEDFAFMNLIHESCVRACVRALRGGREGGGRGFLLPRVLEDALLLLEASHTNRLMVDRNAGRRRHLATHNREADGAWNIVSPHKTVSVSPQLLQPDQASPRLRQPLLTLRAFVCFQIPVPHSLPHFLKPPGLLAGCIF
jgi:hypothetical protein